MNLYLRLKFSFLKIRTKLSSSNIAMERSNIGLDKATTIGVLYSYETPTKNEVIQRFIRDLKNLGKKVSVLCYVTEEDRRKPNGNLLYSFDHQGITFFGEIISDRVQRFIVTPFDYLFHVDITTNALLDYILLNHPAKCRIGHFSHSRRGLFELMIKLGQMTTPVEDIKRLTKQMLHYTACIG